MAKPFLSDQSCWTTMIPAVVGQLGTKTQREAMKHCCYWSQMGQQTFLRVAFELSRRQVISQPEAVPIRSATHAGREEKPRNSPILISCKLTDGRESRALRTVKATRIR